jgi:predicted lipoprotein with Yx(FWY)xxD motif
VNPRRLGTALGLASILLLLLGSGQALAATTTIGQLAPDPSTAEYHEGYYVGAYYYPPYTSYSYAPPEASCSTSQDYLQTSVGSGSAYVVPANGETITAWRTNAGLGAGQEMTLKVFRPVGEASAGTYEVVGHDGPRALAAAASANGHGSLNAFTGLSIPVQPGDLVGLYPNAAATHDACTFTGAGSYMFSGADLANGGSGPFTAASGQRLNLTADVLLKQAAGSPTQHTLTVTDAGTGSGTVQSSPAGIEACNSTCSNAFDEGTTITLTPTPDSYSTFAGWSGACTGTAACQVTLGADAAVTATFNSSPAGGGYTGGYGNGYESGYGTPAAENAGAGAAPSAKCRKSKPKRSKRKAHCVRTRIVAKRAHNATLAREILTTKNGHTLYSLSAEHGKTFICTAGCLSVWHPLTVPAGVRPLGPVKLGTVTRPEGATQVTYHGRPLYTFAEDVAPGETGGQGFKDVGTWGAVVVPPPKP